MKIPKEEAGLWDWGKGSKRVLNGREAAGGGGGGGSSGANVRNSDEDARCERRPSRSYRRPSNDREHRECDREVERREKEPSVRRDQHATNSNTRGERERDRTSEVTKKRNSKAMRYNPGPLTRNPYLNFMREYRKHNTGENIVDLTRQGAKAWQNLPSKDKEEFTNQARRVPAKAYRKKKRRRRFF